MRYVMTIAVKLRRSLESKFFKGHLLVPDRLYLFVLVLLQGEGSCCGDVAVVLGNAFSGWDSLAVQLCIEMGKALIASAFRFRRVYVG